MSDFPSLSSVVSSLRDLFGVPPTKVPMNVTMLVCYVLPPAICSFIAAILAVTPRTHALRVALCPIVALLALRVAFSLEMSLGRSEWAFLNVDLVLSVFCLAMRTFEWAFAKEPLVRHGHPANSRSSTIVDAIDLMFNLRGLGWNWSSGLYVPRQTRPANRSTFAFYAFLSVIVHAWICGAIHRFILVLAPVEVVGPNLQGASIFDETLPFALRYLRSSVLSILTGFSVYAILQLGYDAAAMLAVVLLRHEPARWPPVFESPWFATSLSEFWGRRWHQLFRRIFLVLGGYPLSYVLGRAGMVIGAFLASGIFHQIVMMTLNDRLEFRWMMIGFGMMAPGILAERAFRQLTGRRVGGFVGWMWTMVWLTLGGNMVTEGFSRAGMFSCASPEDSMLPVRLPAERWAIEFDRWLHNI